jgi:hypothetical protein
MLWERVWSGASGVAVCCGWTSRCVSVSPYRQYTGPSETPPSSPPPTFSPSYFVESVLENCVQQVKQQAEILRRGCVLGNNNPCAYSSQGRLLQELRPSAPQPDGSVYRTWSLKERAGTVALTSQRDSVLLALEGAPVAGGVPVPVPPRYIWNLTASYRYTAHLM